MPATTDIEGERSPSPAPRLRCIEPFPRPLHLGPPIDEVSLPKPLPPVSVIGVDFLFEPDVLVELEAYAVLDYANPANAATPLRMP
ncbi:hypothetical protein [Cryobacterium sp. SO1]|uniref:hypothetical protein n=1 Tax=Cryobacterium sp. SO1 TaxID=1897061 RepID=UPI0010238E2C|nr:hypothetical protein [Cryobacterium sp. SO1]RZI34561.1 hypothetical protein BJQ95_03019 [Cryobacterium sp. SO1]